MKKILKKIFRILISALLFFIFFFPFFWMLITSFKTLGETVQFPPSLCPKIFKWQNYVEAFNSIPFFKFLTNSIIVTFSVVILQLITIIPCAYAFALYKFKGSNLIFSLFMLTMMIPSQLVVLPLFIMFSKLGLINTYPSLILPFISSAFGIFMLRQTFKQTPKELIEASKLDKASEFKRIIKVILPMSRPTITTLVLLTFINTWNDYFWPLVLTTKDVVRTLPVGIASLINLESGVKFHILMAGNIMLIIPIIIVFILAQKQIIKAFTHMGDK